MRGRSDIRSKRQRTTLFHNVVLLDLGPVVGAVPEPETYAMLLGGRGLLGFVARRRKQQAA